MGSGGYNFCTDFEIKCTVLSPRTLNEGLNVWGLSLGLYCLQLPLSLNLNA